ncbi:AQP12 [Ramazzottius varieornatus]|uniref:AQP12 n=1 Tax=Ramazzottius varieornatus TaxID=947166 RepID=A0A1D1VDQ6_RAMVA|nr:AQP12 [Ramazzottius varieornatus]
MGSVGQMPSSGIIPPWIFYLLEVVLSTLFVRLAQKLLPKGRIGRFVEDFLCVMQTIIISHENGILKRAYGDAAYYFAIFATTVLFGKLFRSNISTNPAGAVHQFSSKRNMTDMELGIQIALQMSAAWSAYKFVQFLWGLNFCGVYHQQKLMTTDTYSSHIAVNIVAAILIEFAVTFIYRLVHHGEKQLPLGSVWTGIAAAACTYAGYKYTGGYFNPSLAFSMQYNCHGHDKWEFFAVYFLGPVIAAYLVGVYGDSIWQSFQKSTGEMREKSKKEKDI